MKRQRKKEKGKEAGSADLKQLSQTPQSIVLSSHSIAQHRRLSTPYLRCLLPYYYLYFIPMRLSSAGQYYSQMRCLYGAFRFPMLPICDLSISQILKSMRCRLRSNICRVRSLCRQVMLIMHVQQMVMCTSLLCHDSSVTKVICCWISMSSSKEDGISLYHNKKIFQLACAL